MMSLLIRCLFGLVLVIIGLLTLCAWLYPKPPINLYIVKPKILYETFVEPFLIILLMVQLIGSALLMTSSEPAFTESLFFHVTYDLVWLYIFLGFLYCDLIKHASVKTSHDCYFQELKPSHEHYTFTEQELTITNLNLPLKLYASDNGLRRETCLIYLSRDTFSKSRLPSHILYLQKLALKEGYSFAVSSGLSLKTAEIDLTHFIHEAVTTLKSLSYKRLILVGSSEEGHSVLSAAFSTTCDDEAVDVSSMINGVIALYPILDSINISDYAESSRDIPIFLIHGAHDSKASCHTSKKFFDSMAAQHKTICYLELPNIEHDFDKILLKHCSPMDKVAKEITSWLHTYYYE